MDYGLNQQEKMLVASIKEFAEKEYPIELVRELDNREELPKDVVQKMSKVDWFKLPISPEYGGADGTTTEIVLLIEHLSKYYLGVGSAYMMHVMLSRLVQINGNQTQKDELLPKMAKGEIFLAIALTEPDCGTDLLALTSRAEKKGDEYVLNGQKMWISFADIADYIITFMRTDPQAKKKTEGLTLFLVPQQSNGLSINPLHKLGHRSYKSCEVFYDNVTVPSSNILGELDAGLYGLLKALNVERLGCAAMALGVGQAAFENALQFAKDRSAFGRPIGQFQYLQRYISDMAVNLEAARLLLYKAAWLDSQGEAAVLECNMAKLACTEAAGQTTSDAMRVMASAGFAAESDMQRYFRDARLGLFSPVSNEMIRNLICQTLGLPKSY